MPAPNHDIPGIQDGALTHRGLRRSSVRGTAFAFASQTGTGALRVVSTMVLARLLSPDDFGVVAMVAAFTVLAGHMKDLGLSAAAIQAEKLSHQQASNLFWMNVVTSGALALGVAVCAPAIAAFYQDPRVTGAAALAGVSIFVGGFGIQQMALLQRNLLFRKIMNIQLGDALTGTVVSVLLAVAGLGYWSILLGTIAGTACGSLLSWRATQWRPSKPSRRQNTTPLLSYGGYFSGATLLHHLGRNVDNMIVGRMADASTLGIYSKAYSLLLLPLQRVVVPIAAASVPALSRLQSSPGAYLSFYGRATELTAFLLLPVAVLAGVSAREIVLVMLGAKWLAAVPIYQLLMPAAIFSTTYFMANWVYRSLGHVRRLFVVRLVSTGALVLGILVGSRWGVRGVAIAVSAHAALIFLPHLYFCFRGTFLSVGGALTRLARPAVASAVAAAGALLIPQGPPDSVSASLGLAARGAVFTGLYLLTWLLLPGGRRFLFGLRELWKDLKSQETAGPSVSRSNLDLFTD